MAGWAIVVTGASAGLGRGICVNLSARLVAAGIQTEFVLLARNAQGLADTAAMMAGEGPKHAMPTDLSDVRGLEGALEAVKDKIGISEEKFAKVVLIHNAGSLGGIDQLADGCSDAHAVQKYMDLNVTNVIATTASFMQTCRAAKTELQVVNISSLMAVETFPGYGLYCAGKFARDSFHAVVAKEQALNKDLSLVKTLNYAPGPLDTQMQKEIRETHADPGQRDYFGKAHAEGNLIQCVDSADKLSTLLLEDTYASGAHLDFYDLP